MYGLECGAFGQRGSVHRYICVVGHGVRDVVQIGGCLGMHARVFLYASAAWILAIWMRHARIGARPCEFPVHFSICVFLWLKRVRIACLRAPMLHGVVDVVSSLSPTCAVVQPERLPAYTYTRMLSVLGCMAAALISGEIGDPQLPFSLLLSTYRRYADGNHMSRAGGCGVWLCVRRFV